MSGTSKIEWTEQTWNPIVGCSIVSPGCTNCYAMKMAARIEAMGNQPRYAGTTRKVNGNAVWTGKLAHAPESVLLAPLKRKKPTTYFVNSMGDLFHEGVPDEWIDRVFAVMALCPQHTFQVLTKRAARMRDYMLAASPSRRLRVCEAMGSMLEGTDLLKKFFDIDDKNHWARDGSSKALDYKWPLPNVWLGVSTERQQEADERIPLLLQTPAAVRFVSAEPLLGPISFRWAKWDDWIDENGKRRASIDHLDGARKIDWLIVGGESGANARPMHPDWALELRDECAEAGVSFFFKQWGRWSPTHPDWPDCVSYAVANDGTTYLASEIAFPDGPRYGEAVRAGHDKAHLTSMYPLGKAAAGRLLDGIEYNGMPERAA